MEIIILVGVVIAVVLGVLIIAAAARGMRPQAPEPQSYSAPPVTARAASAISNTTPASGLTAQAIAAIDRLITAGHKIQAIKLYRESTGVGLAEAKDRIDHWSISTTAPHTAAVSHMSPTHPSSTRSTLPASVTSEIDRLVAANQKITAIKIYREHTGLGLKESKDAIEAWRSH